MFFKEQTLINFDSLIPATSNLQLATITVQGIKPGRFQLMSIRLPSSMDRQYRTVSADGGSGSLQVTGTADPDPDRDNDSNPNGNNDDNNSDRDNNNSNPDRRQRQQPRQRQQQR